MPKLSITGGLMPSSPIRKLTPYADEAQKRGIKVYHLNIGQPDINSPESALEAIKHQPNKVLAYTHSQGTVSYRKALSDYYKNRGHQMEPDHFIVTNGGSEALLFTFSIIANPGEEIIIPEPFYANYNGFAKQNGINVVPVRSTIENNFGLPPVESFESKITDETRAILINTPGNPTGYIYTREEMEKLRDLVLKHDLYLISDEVYAEYVYDDEEFVSVMDFPELEENAIIIDSESKRFSMCGIRIGAIITKNQEVLSRALKYAQARLCPNILGQYAAEIAHKNVGDYFENSRAEYISRRNLLVEELNKIPGVICPHPKGAFYCMVQLPVKNTEDFAKWLLSDFNHNGETIMIAPGNGFYSDPESVVNQARFAYVLKKEDLKRSVEILKVALEQYNG